MKMQSIGLIEPFLEFIPHPPFLFFDKDLRSKLRGIASLTHPKHTEERYKQRDFVQKKMAFIF